MADLTHTQLQMWSTMEAKALSGPVWLWSSVQTAQEQHTCEQLGTRPHSPFQWAFDTYPLVTAKVQHLCHDCDCNTLRTESQKPSSRLHQLLLNTVNTQTCFGSTALLTHGLWWRKGSLWIGHKAALAHTEQVTIPLFFQQHQAIFLRGELKLKELMYCPQITCHTNCSYKGSKGTKALSKAWGNKFWILWIVTVINLSAG